MNLSCFYQNCKELDLLKCECQTYSVYTCKAHAQHHNLLNPSLLHNYSQEKSIFTKLTTPKFTESLKILLKSYEKIKKDFIETINNLNLKASEFLTNVDKIILDINKKIYNSITNSTLFFQLDEKDYNKNYPIIHASDKDIHNIDQKYWDFIKVPEIKKEFKSIIDSFSDKIFMELKSKFMDDSKDNLYFFDLDSIQLRIFNVDDLSISTKIPHLISMQNNKGGICLVDKNTLFLYEDCENKDAGSYLVDLKKFGTIKIESEMKNSYASCTLFKRKVYIFGGYNGGALQKSHYLDLDELKYYEVSSLPSKQYCTSVVRIEEDFIISGNNSFFCVYDICQNVYKLQMRDKSFGKYHVLMNINKTIYAVLNTYIYVFEYCENKLKNIDVVSIPNAGFSYVIGKPVIRGNFGYFNDDCGDIYRVDLKNFIINLIKETRLIKLD